MPSVGPMEYQQMQVVFTDMQSICCVLAIHHNTIRFSMYGLGRSHKNSKTLSRQIRGVVKRYSCLMCSYFKSYRFEMNRKKIYARCKFAEKCH